MSDLGKSLLKKTTLNKTIKSLTNQELEKLAANLGDVIKKRKADEKKQIESKKQKKLEEIKKLMNEAGLSPKDLGVEKAKRGRKAKAPKKAGTKVAAKYQITDAEGKVHQWTGRGRTPKVFQAYFDQGHTKEECLI
ncbi:H-NS family nucleoid-associated regulatory protein [Aestuariirhabdus litorea]|uniref:DNA-binding protein n=1 Tax=Aestuariirhabdus litorea TaxID=2528527 RepID=A0A3P3VP12_9GAMM|nr:H-NS histone family protein [Aestuariirhabdus litorea]RRJ84501.1 H-NS histone family protein [Aestuariirhabdus litorea]RWW97726.1 H-NS histone family protein [Endozoicomonadaceae bacterium GTF-13]